MAITATPGDALVEPVPEGRTNAGAARVDAIDMLRGLVIVIMVLDHVRDFFHVDALRFDPSDPALTNAALFATRWITHLCAPTFVALAGVSIYFQREGGKQGWALSRFLLTRGAWLVLLELTVVSFGFNFAWPFFFLQVIWAIGAGMICMAALALLPSRVVLGIGVAILLVAPLLIRLTAGAEGAAGFARLVLIARGIQPGWPVLAMYPMLPWLGIMCLGFGLGPLFRLEPARRSRAVLLLALGLLAAFVVLRTLNGYGDPIPWTFRDTTEQTVYSYLAITKYPPSPLYVCATLGVSLLLFLALERLRGPMARILLDFGRTPLFTYLLHIYIAHGLMLMVVLAMGYPAAVALDFLGGSIAGTNGNTGWGFSLLATYGFWLLVVAMLVPLSRWFAGVKRRRRDWWLSYI
jgi:uncharacterized membrane protein